MHILFQWFSIFWLLMCLSSCGSEKSIPTSLPAQSSESTRLQFGSLRIKELFVVIFEKDLSPDAWKVVFDENTQLSLNKRRLREIEGKDDDASQAIRSNAIGLNAELLTRLSSQSIFLLSWSTADENCKFSKDASTLSCRPFNRDNPLSGGLPQSVDRIEFRIPDPVREDITSPYLRIRLVKQGAANEMAYDLLLRLKPENISEKEKWLKGDALPAKGSRFLKSDGDLSSQFFPYGYAEMTLEP